MVSRSICCYEKAYRVLWLIANEQVYRTSLYTSSSIHKYILMWRFCFSVDLFNSLSFRQKHDTAHECFLFPLDSFIWSFEKFDILWISIILLDPSGRLLVRAGLLMWLHLNQSIFALMYFLYYCRLLYIFNATILHPINCTSAARITFEFFTMPNANVKVFRICVRFFPCFAKNANNYFFMLQMCWTVAIELRIKWNSNHTSFVRWNCKEMRKMLIFCVIWDRHGGGRYWPVFFSLSHSNKSKHGHIFPFSSEHQWHQRTNWTLNTGLVYWSRVWLLFIFCFTSEIQHEIDPNSN